MRIPLLLGVCVGSLVSWVDAQSFRNVTDGQGLANQIPGCTVDFGVGLCCGDFDGDGDQDLVVADDPGRPMKYFRNDGAAGFSDQTGTAGIVGGNEIKQCLAADVDNDGDLDLLCCGWQSAAALYINDGSGSFTEDAAARGLTHVTSNYSAAFGDVDRDGWIDLYLGNRGAEEPNIFYRNTGNGFFTDETVTAGLGHVGLSFAVAFIDYDEDGWPDVLCINDKGGSFTPNALYRNDGDGTFTDVTAATRTGIAIDGMGVDAADIFNDGGVDFYASDLPNDHLFQVWDPALGHYVEAQATYGVQGGGIGWGVNFADFDNDCWQDIHVVQMGSPNLLFRNPGQPAAALAPWTDEAAALNIDPSYEQFSAVFFDYDNDGGIDILNRFSEWPSTTPIAQGLGLYRNEVPRGNWVKFELHGRQSNASGIGARVNVTANGMTQRQWVRSGSGFLAGSDLRLHYGLGTAAVAEVEVWWPSGLVQRLVVGANQVVDVYEPTLDVYGSGVAQYGDTSMVAMDVPNEVGSVYALMIGLNDRPGLPLPDGRRIPIRLDDLAVYSLTAGNSIMPSSVGVVPSGGVASSMIRMPQTPMLSGRTFYVTGVTFGPPPFLVRTVFPEAEAITIQ